MEPKKVRIIKEKPVLPTLYKNVGIYCRVSSNTQEQLNSMAGQVSFLFSYLADVLTGALLTYILTLKAESPKITV